MPIRSHPGLPGIQLSDLFIDGFLKILRLLNSIYLDQKKRDLKKIKMRHESRCHEKLIRPHRPCTAQAGENAFGFSLNKFLL
jgi:hypothetical protein